MSYIRKRSKTAKISKLRTSKQLRDEKCRFAHMPVEEIEVIEVMDEENLEEEFFVDEEEFFEPDSDDDDPAPPAHETSAEKFLQWTKEIEDRLKRDDERRKAESAARDDRRKRVKTNGQKEAARLHSQSIRRYFPCVQLSEHCDYSDCDDSDDEYGDVQHQVEQAGTALTPNAAIERLNNELSLSKNTETLRKSERASAFDHFQKLSVRSYLEMRFGRDCVKAMKASIDVATVVYSKTKKFSYKARCIRNWAKQYLARGSFLEYHQGKHRKTLSIINHEDVQILLRKKLREMSGVQRCPKEFAKLLRDDIFPSLPDAPTTVSEKTATRWMRFLGFEKCEHKKGYYVDGHERDDVILHRTAFLEEVKELEKRMILYEGIEMELECYPLAFAPQSKPIVFITHDECVVYANDANKILWVENGHKELRQKSNGRSIMISGFCCHCHGFLKSPEDASKRSFVTIEPGSSRDGYWTNENLVNQLVDVMPLFQECHPGCDLVFAFDNSQNHHAYKSDALVASKLPLSDGGKNAPKMRSTRFVDHRGNSIDQPLQLPDGGAKGIRTILQERNLWREYPRMLLTCEECKNNITPVDQVNCCARRTLQMQPDFASQREWLREVVENAGHRIIYYPKFHCELNFIEMMWAYLKSQLRKGCTFNFQHLEQNIPLILDSIPPRMPKKMAQHCFRYMDGYRLGVTGALLDYAVKIYKSHRRIPEYVTKAQIEESYERNKNKKR